MKKGNVEKYFVRKHIWKNHIVTFLLQFFCAAGY